MMHVKIAVCQLNPIVGDLEGNFGMMVQAYEEAARKGADLVVMPECVLTGYPLEDLVLRESFVEAVAEKTTAFVAAVTESGHSASVIFGAPHRDREHSVLVNSAFLLDPTLEIGRLVRVDKSELPNYGVFDEKRVYQRQEHNNGAFGWRGFRIGLMICEDAWFPAVSDHLMTTGAAFLIAINGSPFEVGKNVIRRQVVANRVKETGLPFLYVNMVGGQDELVFDGGSFMYDGQRLQEAPHFEEGVFYFDAALRPTCAKNQVTLDNYPTVEPTGTEAIYQACVLGTRDYMRKQGFKSVVLGYSGGVDSGLVAAIAADAIGPENVHLVRLPSKFSSVGSLDDAEAGADRLGAPMRTIGIEAIVDQLRNAYTTATYSSSQVEQDYRKLGERLTGVADENIQARARGNILMAISNQEGRLLLTTGNKSEVSVGYCTLYGDMSGGYNPIKDCYKTVVWEMCRWRNQLYQGEIADLGFLGPEAEVVPEEIIVKPPSAELRPDQKDSDSLPPYDVLDRILYGMIEAEKSVAQLVQDGFDEETVKRIRNLIDRNEYKRRQAAPGIKITSKLHGRERRYPIVNSWRA